MCLINSHKFIRQFKHMVPQNNDDEMLVLGLVLDIVRNNGDILEVQRRVDFVKDIQRRRLIVMQCENQTQRRKSLLSSGEVGDLLPGLLERSD